MLAVVALVAASCGGGASEQGTAWDVDAARASVPTDDVAREAAPESTTTEPGPPGACAALADYRDALLGDLAVERLAEIVTEFYDAVAREGLPPFGVEEGLAAAREAFAAGPTDQLAPWDYVGLFEGIAMEGSTDARAEDAWRAVAAACPDAIGDPDRWFDPLVDCVAGTEALLVSTPLETLTDPDASTLAVTAAFRRVDYPLACVGVMGMADHLLPPDMHGDAFDQAFSQFSPAGLAVLRELGQSTTVRFSEVDSVIG